MEMIRSRRRLTSPVLRREHEVSRKPLRRECRSDFGVPVLACVRLFVLHARQWVRRAPGIPCALRFSRDENDAKLGHGGVARMLNLALHSVVIPGSRQEARPGMTTEVGITGSAPSRRWRCRHFVATLALRGCVARQEPYIPGALSIL